ncbi:disease resistance protein RPS2 [Cinnamomum micranthum f. kanehirae]|uniref:Disease resistance protein RPS2 n=1 Tax=Cinnamomum micranthum f. kanehirae TaxID=337451 RepID=A0A3S3NZW4_9MAGN|nr:disease resistance protein RPS2 [Cinnamomum micranthum f. kanehirae]
MEGGEHWVVFLGGGGRIAMEGEEEGEEGRGDGDEFGPIGRQIGYSKNLKKNMKELDKQDLFAARDDVLDKINSNKPYGVCNKWLENVKQIEDEVKAIREEFEGGQEMSYRVVS